MSIDPDKLHIIRSKPKHDSHTDAIRKFEGDFECLSNTYKCLVSLRGDSEPYPSVEHALQASKTDDAELRNTIRQAKNAIEAKKAARVVKPTVEWRAGSEKIVEALIRDKFRRNEKARAILLATGRVRLVYTNTHDDKFWGICGGKGENKLGKLLEKVRADALAGKDTDVWCSMRFQLAAPLDVGVEFAVTKAGKVVAEPSFEGKPVVRMGKLAENEIVMAHPSVSRSHALLVVDKTYGAYLIDLGASNGSFVDGKRMTPFVPEAVKAGGAGLTFAKSKRTYRLTRVEMDLREAKKSLLYASMSDPTVSAEQPDPDSTIYVGNLEPSVTEQDLREFFEECGEIASVRIPQDKETGKMRGIAFIAFAKHAGVLHALTLHMDDLKGQSVKVRRAESKSDTSKKPPNKSFPPSKADARDTGRRPETIGRGPSNGSSPAPNSALEVATAAIIRAAEASRANATAAANTVGSGTSRDGLGDDGSKRQKTNDQSHDSRRNRRGGDEESTSGHDRHERKRRHRWGDPSSHEKGDGDERLPASAGGDDARGTGVDDANPRSRGGRGREGSSPEGSRRDRDRDGSPRDGSGRHRSDRQRDAARDAARHGDSFRNGGSRDDGVRRDRKTGTDVAATRSGGGSEREYDDDRRRNGHRSGSRRGEYGDDFGEGRRDEESNVVDRRRRRRDSSRDRKGVESDDRSSSRRSEKRAWYGGRSTRERDAGRDDVTSNGRGGNGARHRDDSRKTATERGGNRWDSPDGGEKKRGGGGRDERRGSKSRSRSRSRSRHRRR